MGVLGMGVGDSWYYPKGPAWVLVIRQRLGIGVSLALPVTIATIGIGMCEGVGE